MDLLLLFDEMHARVQLPSRLRYSPFQVGKMLLHNVSLPNLLLITTLTLFMCLSSIVCIHKRIHRPPQTHTRVYIHRYLAQLLALRQLLKGVPLVTLRTGVQSRRCHSPPTYVTELEEVSGVQQ